ncbi:MAG: cytochrome c family protein [Armatimonadetes bacterium]|nr:cytochrome c family protein [Armatimonadota bacterium]
MKLLVLAAGVCSLAFGMFAKSPESQGTTLVVAGDLFGYLAPCGCTKPMAGGVARWASAVKALREQGETVVVVNGGLVDAVERQDELKAETLAETFKLAGADAVHLTGREARLGLGQLGSIDRLSGNALVTSSIAESPTFEYRRFIESGPFLIGAVETNPDALAAKLGESKVDPDKAVSELLSEAQAKGLAPVLLFAGDEDMARAVAKSRPGLAAIVYQGSSPPSAKAETEGSTVLLTPGEKGRVLVSVSWDGRSFRDYRVLLLGPEFKDDDDAARANLRYLDRVTEEKLLERIPRADGPDFAGSEACGDCHSDAMKVWKASGHAKALKTLEDVHHDRDPDCVHCHVVGLGSTKGFMDRATTPRLADVGCESCHGPGAAHAKDPGGAKMGTVGPKSCQGCHVGDHSPKFEFDTYWPQIRH